MSIIDKDKEKKRILIEPVIKIIKDKNFSRDPRVSLSLVNKNNPYSMVTIQGTVIEQTTKGADEHIDKLAKKYLNIDIYPSHSPSIKRVICKIKPEKMYYLPPRYTEFIGKS